MKFAQSLQQFGASQQHKLSFHGNILTLNHALNEQRNGYGIEADTIQSH